MKQRRLARLRALISILFGRPVPVSLPTGDGHLFSDLRVLPAISGADDGDEGGDGGEGDSGDADAGDDADKGSGDGSDADGADDAGGGAEDDADDTDEEPGKREPDWKAESRKHERRAKKTKRELDELKGKLKKQEDERKSEHEKALEKAREEGRSEALTKAEKERQADRLEVAVTRIAAKPIKVGEGEESKSVKFADSEDAHVYLQRAVQNGDLDAEDIFGEDGKVDSSVISEALQEILESKPHLAEDHKPHKPSGDADAGKGTSKNTELEDMSPEELHKLAKNG